MALPRTPRIMFLDDAPDRAVAFLAGHPGAVCVQTVGQCLDLLEQPWDDVHLDHDLGGEVLVDHERPDCGMAVVRWLCEEPRPHLRDTRFLHSYPQPECGRYNLDRRLAAREFRRSLFHYVANQAFHPSQKLPKTWLEELTGRDRTGRRPP